MQLANPPMGMKFDPATTSHGSLSIPITTAGGIILPAATGMARHKWEIFPFVNY